MTGEASDVDDRAEAPSAADDRPDPEPGAPEGEACLVFEDLSVEGPRGEIIAPSNVTLHAGEIALVVGLSGAGKTLLCNLILGTLPAETEGVEVGGRILLDGVDILSRRPPEVRRRLGAVFQLHQLGLFDDLSVDRNLGFAAGGSWREAAARWREELLLEDAPDPVGMASGGQRQRIALARTLERGSEVLLFDEPTTGLDPDAAARTVRLIREHHRRLTLVVTHDYESFLPVVDRVLFIDPVSKEIQDATDADDLGDLVRVRAEESARLPRPEREAGRLHRMRTALRRAWARLALTADRLARDALAILLTGPIFCWYLLGDWRCRRQAARSLGRFFSPGTLAYVGVAAGLIGLVSTFFVYERLPMKVYVEPLFLEDLLRGLGFAIFRVLGPLFAAILVAAKVGASVTASVSTMSYHREIDALQLLDVSPRNYLLWPIVTGFVVGMLFLAAYAIVVASGVSAICFLHFHPDLTPTYWWRHFSDRLSWTNGVWVVAKTVVAAVGAGVIAYDAGATPKRSSEEIGTAIHRTILWGLLWVLVVHAGFSFFEFPPTPQQELDLLR